MLKTPAHAIFISLRGLVITAAWVVIFTLPLNAQNISQNSLPVFWRPFDFSKPPSTKGYRVLNIAVDMSHPPFSYKDATGRLTGFSVELARTICQGSGLTCRFEAVAWKDIQAQLQDGRADMAIASLQINQKAREKLAFTNRYFINPARFLSLKTSSFTMSDSDAMSGKNIAVIAGTAHEAFLKKYYSSADIISYKDRQSALRDVRIEKVDVFFSDGVSLLYWMASAKARACCKFLPGAYTQSFYFGEGIGFSVIKENARLAKIFNFGLERARRSGLLDRLYQIHFPGSLY